jgi:hypothetical protein
VNNFDDDFSGIKSFLALDMALRLAYGVDDDLPEDHSWCEPDDDDRPSAEEAKAMTARLLAKGRPVIGGGA